MNTKKKNILIILLILILLVWICVDHFAQYSPFTWSEIKKLESFSISMEKLRNIATNEPLEVVLDSGEVLYVDIVIYNTEVSLTEDFTVTCSRNRTSDSGSKCWYHSLTMFNGEVYINFFLQSFDKDSIFFKDAVNDFLGSIHYGD